MEFTNKNNEMPEACVEMSFCIEVIEDGTIMRMINVCIDTEEAFEHGADGRNEVEGKRVAYLCWKYAFVIQIFLNPFHQLIDISWSRYF